MHWRWISPHLCTPRTWAWTFMSSQKKTRRECFFKPYFFLSLENWSRINVSVYVYIFKCIFIRTFIIYIHSYNVSQKFYTHAHHTRTYKPVLLHTWGIKLWSYSNIVPTDEIFKEAFPGFYERSETEQRRLYHIANWMDLAFYTLSPRRNKSLMLNLIARIVEGKNAKFIMSSAQNKKTMDRVYLFQMLGNCDDSSPRRQVSISFKTYKVTFINITKFSKYILCSPLSLIFLGEQFRVGNSIVGRKRFLFNQW